MMCSVLKGMHGNCALCPDITAIMYYLMNKCFKINCEPLIQCELLLLPIDIIKLYDMIDDKMKIPITILQNDKMSLTRVQRCF